MFQLRSFLKQARLCRRVVIVRVFVKKTEKTPAARDRPGADPREIGSMMEV